MLQVRYTPGALEELTAASQELYDSAQAIIAEIMDPTTSNRFDGSRVGPLGHPIDLYQDLSPEYRLYMRIDNGTLEVRALLGPTSWTDFEAWQAVENR